MKTLEQRLEAAQDEIEAIKAEMAKKESKFVWPLPKGTYHWRYYSDGLMTRFEGLDCDFNYNQAISEKRAIQNRETTRLLQDMTLFVDYNAPGWIDEVDWVNDRQTKWGLRLTYPNNVCVDCLWMSNSFVLQVSCPTGEMAEAMLEIFGDRIRELFL